MKFDCRYFKYTFYTLLNILSKGLRENCSDGTQIVLSVFGPRGGRWVVVEQDGIENELVRLKRPLHLIVPLHFNC